MADREILDADPCRDLVVHDAVGDRSERSEKDDANRLHGLSEHRAQLAETRLF